MNSPHQHRNHWDRRLPAGELIASATTTEKRRAAASAEFLFTAHIYKLAFPLRFSASLRLYGLFRWLKLIELAGWKPAVPVATQSAS